MVVHLDRHLTGNVDAEREELISGRLHSETVIGNGVDVNFLIGVTIDPKSDLLPTVASMRSLDGVTSLPSILTGITNPPSSGGAGVVEETEAGPAETAEVASPDPESEPDAHPVRGRANKPTTARLRTLHDLLIICTPGFVHAKDSTRD